MISRGRLTKSATRRIVQAIPVEGLAWKLTPFDQKAAERPPVLT
jgi:hypothetical protein